MGVTKEIYRAEVERVARECLVIGVGKAYMEESYAKVDSMIDRDQIPMLSEETTLTERLQLLGVTDANQSDPRNEAFGAFDAIYFQIALENMDYPDFILFLAICAFAVDTKKRMVEIAGMDVCTFCYSHFVGDGKRECLGATVKGE